MAGRSHSYSGWPVLLLLIVVGGIIGGWLGETLVKLWPYLKALGVVYRIGIPAFTVDLHVFSFTFGFMLNINIFTILGFVIAYLVFRRL